MIDKIERNLHLIPSLLLKSYEIAQKSPDPSSQNGALLYSIIDYDILSEDCNTFPDGIQHTDERWNSKDLKYKLVDHAEARVLLTAHKNEVFKKHRPSDLWLVCPWAACTSCAKHIIGFGIKTVITHKQGMGVNHGHWVEEVKVSKMMFEECGVIYYEYEGFLDSCKIRRNGELVSF